jgi:iron(III) transport system permease protein
MSVTRASARRSDGGGWTLAALFVAAIVLAPIVALFAIAAQGSGDLWPHLLAYVLPQAVHDTALLLLGVGVVTVVVGAGTAWLVTTAAFRAAGSSIGRCCCRSVPTYIVAFAYLDILHPLGPIQTALRALLAIEDPRGLWLPDVRSLPGCILLLGFVLYPYVYLAARATFLMQSAPALEVARTLGAGRFATFLRVALPLARPAIAVGATLAMLEALNDIGASEFLGVRTFTVSIYATWVNRSSLPGAAQIALVMLAAVLALVLLERWGRRHRQFSGGSRRSHPPALAELSGFASIGALAACGAPVLIGFVLPAAHLVNEAWARIGFVGLSPTSWSKRATASCLRRPPPRSRCTRSRLAHAARLDRSGLADAAARVGSLGYAIRNGARGRTTGASCDLRQRIGRRSTADSRLRHRAPDFRFGSGARARLCDPFPRHLRRRRRSGLCKDSGEPRHGRAQLGREHARHHASRASAAAEALARRRGDPGVRRLHEGIAGDSPAAAVRLRNARHPHLCRGGARHV